jgi:hypothetical protein
MKEINLNKYGPIISSKSVGKEIYDLIKESLKKNKNIIIKVDNIRSMATFCAKQIFGRLYVELGSENFFDKININGADDDLKTIIQIGIQHALEEK